MEYEEVTHRVTERTLGRLPSGDAVTVTVHRYVGGAGPTAYVQAAQHGIELNGPAAARRLHERLVDAHIAGTVIVVPVVNALAFDNRSYMTPAAYDAVNPNLNRVWPGDSEGTLQERLAASLWDLLDGVDAVVDLHTGTPEMLEHVRVRAGRPAAKRLGEAFGTDYLLTDDESTDDEGFSGTFRAASAREGIPALTAELANSGGVAHAAVETGVEGILNVLRELGLLDGRPTPSPGQTVLRDAPEATTAAASGLFEPRPGVGVGDRIEAGEEIGTVYCPSTFEQRQTVTATSGGLAYSLSSGGVVFAGERLLSVAEPI